LYLFAASKSSASASEEAEQGKLITKAKQTLSNIANLDLEINEDLVHPYLLVNICLSCLPLVIILFILFL
jgi:hypothetical protein